MLAPPAWDTLAAASAQTGAALLRTASPGLCTCGTEKVLPPTSCRNAPGSTELHHVPLHFDMSLHQELQGAPTMLAS